MSYVEDSSNYLKMEDILVYTKECIQTKERRNRWVTEENI
jgi:hypothetical protein